MPYFTLDTLEVDVHGFVDACGSFEIIELIDYLDSTGDLEDNGYCMCTDIDDYGDDDNQITEHRSDSERMFEAAVNKLHGKWNLLSKKDEELILKISKQF